MGGAQGAALPETFELGLRTTLATGDVEAAFGIYGRERELRFRRDPGPPVRGGAGTFTGRRVPDERAGPPDGRGPCGFAPFRLAMDAGTRAVPLILPRKIPAASCPAST